MAPTAALLQETVETARSGRRQPGNAFVNKLSELNHLSNSHVKRPPHARSIVEGGASVFPQIYYGNISGRAKRALERQLRPHTTPFRPMSWPIAADQRKHDLEHPARQHKRAIWPRASAAGRFSRGVIPARGFQWPQLSLL